MPRFGRWLLLIGLALAVPIVPFVLFGDRLEAAIEDWLSPPPPAWVVALATVGVLATDILLPVPSSVVSTLAGAELGILPATLASWLGMNLGAMLGFALAKQWGRALALRLSSADDLAQMDGLAQRFGPLILVMTRALPVLAEAAVLLLGSTSLAWRRFLPPVLLSNLGLALAYSAFGQIARTSGELPLALVASMALPLLATAFARRWMR